ncbi:hypothetical protein TFLX_03152 [Thermoflexales bacterium]|nr:hypothetical protein TFLX_03152 [Thermoflexales bacterium]
MAYQLYLIRRPDRQASDGASPDVFDLQKYMVEDGWEQGTPQPNQDRVDEAITLHVKPDEGASQNDDGLAEIMHALDLKIRQIATGQSLLSEYGVWLRAKQFSESQARQAYITAARRSQTLKVRTMFSAAQDYVISDYVLGLTRMPFWEAQASRTIAPDGDVIDINGGMFTYQFITGILGDAPYRVAKLAITPVTDDVLTEFWIGVRGNYYYNVNVANFQPVWNLKDAYYYSDVAIEADSDALSGSRLTCDFDTHPEEVTRAIMKASQATANPDDQVGNYNLLLRAAMSDGSSEALVRVGSGFYGGTNEFAFGSHELISGTGYKYYEVGNVSLPSSYVPLQDAGLANMALKVKAQRLSGSGSLYLDVIGLLPAEHSLHFKDASVQTVESELYRFAEVYVLPNDVVAGKSYDTSVSQPVDNLDIDSSNWGLPPQSINVVCVAQGSASFKGVNVGMSLQCFPRWDSLRGVY